MGYYGDLETTLNIKVDRDINAGKLLNKRGVFELNVLGSSIQLVIKSSWFSEHESFDERYGLFVKAFEQLIGVTLANDEPTDETKNKKGKKTKPNHLKKIK